MRLIGSLTEDRLRDELLRSNAALRAAHQTPTLQALLQDRGVDLATAFVIDWVPEQSEDIYTVLNGNRQVLTIELSRRIDGTPPLVESTPFATFRESISKGSRLARLKFAVASALASQASGADA
jgi:hypothetical protein